MVSRQGISESEFFMWRAVFAFAVADRFLSIEEQKMLHSYMAAVPFSAMQLDVMKRDFKDPPDAEEMYKKITERQHQVRFCALARALAWCEGDMDMQEEIILKRVGCLKVREGRRILEESGKDVELRNYHAQYKKAGLSGFFRPPKSFEMRV